MNAKVATSTSVKSQKITTLVRGGGILQTKAISTCFCYLKLCDDDGF